METGTKTARFLIGIGVVFLQLIMTQVVMFLFSMFIPDVEKFQQSYPVFFALIAGLAFSAGVFLAGWLALKLGWLKGHPRLANRLIGTLACAYLPLVIALLIYRILEAGNPFFLISILASILGFHFPGWLVKQ